MIKSEQNKRDEKIIEAYLSGESVRMVGARFGLTTQRIHQVLDMNHIPKRRGLTSKK